jgi:hypothetical protein
MPLSPASQLKASEELNEPSNPDEVIARARGLVIELIGVEEQQRFEWALPAMLRQAKWDVDRAVKKMHALSAYAGKHPELFQDASAGEFIGQAGVEMMSHLPARNSRGELVLLVDGEKLSPYAREYTLTDMLRFSVFYMSVIMRDEETQVNGVVIVENLENYPLTALSRMSGTSFSGIKACFDWMHMSPLRLRVIYACKQPWYVGVMLKMVTPFMSKKLKERVYLFGDDVGAMLVAAGLTADQVPPRFGGTLDGFDYAWHLR